ncbi:MAG: hypothetical protein WBD17_04280 [Candidatus Omnitrophota bacterium]
MERKILFIFLIFLSFILSGCGFVASPSKKADSARPMAKAVPEAGEPVKLRETKFIMLNSGGYIEGIIKEETKERVTVEIGGGTKTINKADIREIRED